MLSGFILAGHVPMLNTEFSVTFPATVKVSYKTYGDMKGVQFKQTTANGKTTYVWKAQNLKAYPIENDAPSLRFYAPQVFLFMENYTANGQTVEVLGDISKLFNYYKNLVKNINKVPDSQLKSVTDSLTRGKSDVDKIKAVYYWVQDHIKYIAFEEGMAGFVPRQAADVYRKRYGDCKDMASLVSTMLRQANVPAHLVWIGTRDIPYRYDENPSMSVDNHMIAAVKVNNEWQFLDATDDRIDFGLPTTHIQGKEAMVMTGEDAYEIVKVPIVPATQNSRYDSMTVSWKDKNLIGKGYLRFDGHSKGYVKSVLQYKSEPQRDEYLRQSLLSRGSNKCLLESKKITNLDVRDQPLRFEYTFTVPDYVQQVNQEAFVNPHLIRTWANNRIEETRQNDWKYNHEFTEASVINIPLAANDEVTYLPKNVSFNHPKFGFDFKYEQKNKQVTVHTNYRLNTLLVKKEDFAEWNKMVLALNEAYGEVISIKKTTN
jgi:Transglutaminase-like superfamily